MVSALSPDTFKPYKNTLSNITTTANIIRPVGMDVENETLTYYWQVDDIVHVLEWPLTKRIITLQKAADNRTAVGFPFRKDHGIVELNWLNKLILLSLFLSALNTVSAAMNISFISLTPDNNSINTTGRVFVNTSVSFVDGYNMTSFIDWNDSIVGWWRMNENPGGTLVEDSSGYGNNGIWEGNTTANVTSGIFGKALLFDAVNDSVNVSTSPSLNLTGDFTIKGWIYPRSFGQGGFGRIVNKKNGSASTGYEFNIATSSPTRGLNFIAGLKSYASKNNTVSLNVWQQVAVTRRGSNLTFYVNDTVAGTAIVPAIKPDSSNLFIGKRGHDNLRWFDGSIDDVIIDTRAWSYQEIKASYQAQNNRLYNNFIGLSAKNYTFRAFVQDATGNVTSTETRRVTVSKSKLLKSSDGWSGAIPISAINEGEKYIRAKIISPSGKIHYTNLTLNPTSSNFEGVIYVGSWECAGCADPDVGTFSVVLQTSSTSDFASTTDYYSGSFTTFITRRYTGDPNKYSYTSFIPTSIGGGLWNHTISDLKVYANGSRNNIIVAFPMHPITASISNISVSYNNKVIPRGNKLATGSQWWYESSNHVLYLEFASLSTNITHVNINFTSDTDLFATRIDRYNTPKIADRLFYNGLIISNKNITTAIIGGGNEGAGEQIDLHTKNSTKEITVDCMERVALWTDNIILSDRSGYYPRNIKWNQNEYQKYITTENNAIIKTTVHSDDTVNGWIQNTSNYLSAFRIQIYRTQTTYIENNYTFMNYNPVPRTFSLVWSREQWLGTNRYINDRGRYSGDSVDRNLETKVSINTLPHSWLSSYEDLSYALIGMGVGFNSTVADYGYFLSSEPVNTAPEYPIVIANTSTIIANNTVFEKKWISQPANTAFGFTFYQFGLYKQSWQDMVSEFDSITFEAGIVSLNGGENWARGTNQMIRWAYRGTPGSYIKIELLKRGVFNRTIKSSTSIGKNGSGSYSWSINTTQAPGTDYKVRVTSTTNTAFTDTSNKNFTISGGITVTSPNGKENWTRGSTQKIQWYYSGSPGARVKIELLKGGVFNRTINSSTPAGSNGSGSYNWSINSTQVPGTNYKVRITSTTNSAYTDTSNNNFTII